MEDFIEEFYCATPGKSTRYNFSLKSEDGKGHKLLVPQVVVTIQQDNQKIELERIQIEGLYKNVKERQEKLDGD